MQSLVSGTEVMGAVEQYPPNSFQIVGESRKSNPSQGNFKHKSENWPIFLMFVLPPPHVKIACQPLCGLLALFQIAEAWRKESSRNTYNLNQKLNHPFSKQHSYSKLMCLFRVHLMVVLMLNFCYLFDQDCSKERECHCQRSQQ